MNKYTKIQLNRITKDIESNFSEVIDFIIYYDSIDADEKAWDLVYMIEEFGHAKEIELMLADFESRDLTTGPTLLYNALLYRLVNNEESKSVLVNVLKQGNYSKFTYHLFSLDKKKSREGDLNVADVFKQLNSSDSTYLSTHH